MHCGGVKFANEERLLANKKKGMKMTPKEEMLLNYWKEKTGHYKDTADYFRRKPVTWLTRKEMSDIMIENNWKIPEDKFRQICGAIKKKVVSINSRDLRDPT